MQDITTWLANLLYHQQLTPLVVLFLFPLLFLLFFQTLRHISLLPSTILMVLESFGFSFPWPWGSGQAGPSSPHDSKKLRKKHIRSRADHIELNGHARPGTSSVCRPSVGCVEHSTSENRSARGLLPWPRQYFGDILFHELYFTGSSTFTDIHNPDTRVLRNRIGYGVPVLPATLSRRYSRESSMSRRTFTRR